MSTIAEWSGYCLSCPRPRCETGCPTGNHIRDFIKALKEEKLDAAGEILYSINPFPELTSRLCDCTRQCQGHCVRGLRQTPVQIQNIERYISDHVKRKIKPAAYNGKKIACIGAGPACLAAAIDFLEAGYRVDIYEKTSQIGGAIYSGIPDYRFDKNYLQNIYQDLVTSGVHFYFNQHVGETLSLTALKKEYAAILVGIGAQGEKTYGMTAQHGSMGGLSLLHDLNVNKQATFYRNHYQKAIVWGGGNVAMDCARSLIRLLDDVKVIYRRSEAEMPANFDEIAQAKKEGVQFLFLKNAKALQTDENGNVVGVLCVDMELGEKGEDGRFSTHEVTNSERSLAADLFVAAVGQKVDFSILDPSLSLTENHATTHANVYVTGDAYLGPQSVASAIHDGREAAKLIITSLQQ